ncbi:S8 family serine peptidase [Noviherbaspirillum suwonense]|uniref:Trypsin-like peptidase domain-containing protein n=1 Tax=Noviherbaspirillum suwonense TaxID=1224511 RepID=A0ABY1QVC2_9BURK|nr:S8 family serine peptidase [Noviherbaspirillum suwonense]SMP81213.1 Trypsin-like peptidase domain-containing protein [Noviherbaspirillum suwonense]
MRPILEFVVAQILVLGILALMGGPSHALVIDQDDTVPVALLRTNDPVRQAGQSVGVLVAKLPSGSEATCTTAIISDRHILTAAHCVEGAESLTTFFGLGSDREEFRVLTPAAEIDKQRNYAVLEVEGVPSRKFNAARLLLRIPIQGESAFILSMNTRSELTAAQGCSVRGTTTDGLILHDCDTTPGSSGALLFSTKDLAILGLHLGSTFTDQLNQASPMYSIGLASSLVRSLATIRPPIIDFHTVGSKPSEIASDFKRLYLTLHSEGRLPLKSYPVDRFSTIEEVFRSNGLFYGSPFPIELDSLVCDLNPNVCWRERQQVNAQERKSGTSMRDALLDAERPSGNLKPSSGNWSVAPPTSLWLPSVRVEKQQGWIVYQKRSGEDIGAIVTNEFGSCDRFDDECRQLIIGMNRNQKDRLTRAYSGAILLPKASYSVFGIDISTASEKVAGQLVEVKVDSRQGNGTLVLQANDVATIGKPERPKEAEYRILLPRNSSGTPTNLDAVLKSLGPTASGSTRVVPNQAPAPAPAPVAGSQARCKGNEANACEMDPSDLAIYQKRLLNGIFFPYLTLPHYPAIAIERPGRVGIIDTDLDLDHCAFNHLKLKGRLKPVDTNVPASAPMGLGHTPCKWLKPYREVTGSHGTHVAGLMVGQIGNESWGLNPFATLFAGRINTTTIGQQVQVSNLELAKLLRNMLNAAIPLYGLDVVNLSIYYERERIGARGPGGIGARPSGDPLLNVIRSDGYHTLFVVAAGNDSDDFTDICDLRPACFDLPNVISVAALDGSAQGAALLTGADGGSNYGNRVHVAAPGVDVLSPINGNYLGLLSGTSQAAPQVAAIASILRSLKPNATPGDVKERLITCSYPVPPPAGAADPDAIAIFGGRIDSKCTLAPDGEGMLQLNDARGTYRVKRILPEQAVLRFEAAFGGYEAEINTKHLRGLRSSGSNPNEFTIFYKRSPENRDAPLSKDVRLFLKSGALNLEVWDDAPPGPSGWKTRRFQASRIERFVAPMVSR